MALMHAAAAKVAEPFCVAKILHIMGIDHKQKYFCEPISVSIKLNRQYIASFFPRNGAVIALSDAVARSLKFHNLPVGL